jgi:hypothetical protein
MSIKLYKDDMQPYSLDPMRTFHNGYLGGSHEEFFYLRNDDASNYYTNIVATPQMVGGYNDNGEFGITGWGIKLMYGRRRPTETEWDLVRSGDGIQLPDIGSSEAADTFTNHPVWVRVYCPAGQSADIRENMQIAINYHTKKVGA